MAQTLDHNNSITTVVPVEIPLFEDDLVIIQKLDDEPNDVGGLTAAELKAEFDKGNLTAQTYINQTLIPRIVAEGLTEQARQAAESERVSNEIERVTNENARVKAESDRSTAEALRAAAEEGRVKAEQERASAETTRSDKETQRAGAEQARAAAEAARVQAEQKRVDTNNGIVAMATAQANAAAGNAERASRSEGNAAAAASQATAAKAAAEQAKSDAESAAETAAEEAVNLVDTQLAQYVADAQAAKRDAETARDEAAALAGGDFLERSTYDPTGRKRDIFAYVDEIAEGKAASSHNQAASTITAGTFAGQVVANGSGQTPGASLLRNSRLVSADTNPTINGEICWTYK